MNKKIDDVFNTGFYTSAEGIFIWLFLSILGVSQGYKANVRGKSSFRGRAAGKAGLGLR